MWWTAFRFYSKKKFAKLWWVLWKEIFCIRFWTMCGYSSGRLEGSNGNESVVWMQQYAFSCYRCRGVWRFVESKASKHWTCFTWCHCFSKLFGEQWSGWKVEVSIWFGKRTIGSSYISICICQCWWGGINARYCI